MLDPRQVLLLKTQLLVTTQDPGPEIIIEGFTNRIILNLQRLSILERKDLVFHRPEEPLLLTTNQLDFKILIRFPRSVPLRQSAYTNYASIGSPLQQLM
jgi:hypothetical protein